MAKPKMTKEERKFWNEAYDRAGKAVYDAGDYLDNSLGWIDAHPDVREHCMAMARASVDSFVLFTTEHDDEGGDGKALVRERGRRIRAARTNAQMETH